MEHLIILLIEFGRWIDRQFQKPLGRAIPHLDLLLRDPRGTLAGETITIGPVKRYASGFLLGLLVSLLGSAVAVLVFILGAESLHLPVRKHPEILIVLGVILLAVLGGSFWLVFYLRRGGQLVLSADRVEFRYRASVVRCPWALFSAAGQPFLGRDRLLVPVAPAAIPFVEEYRHDCLRATGALVKTWQFHLKSSGTEAVLNPLYEVQIEELGGLLLQLGALLGGTLPDGSPAVAAPAPETAAAPAAPDADGWITVRVTRLVFPPFCCDCGSPTGRVEEYRGYVPVFRLGPVRIDTAECASFQAPVCEDCHADNRRRFWGAVWKGVGIGLGVALLLSVFLSLLLGEPRVMVVFIPLGVIAGLIGLGIGRAVGKKRAAPLELERYSPSKGTIAIRFRWPEYGERLLAFLRAQDALAEGTASGKAASSNS